MPPSAVADDPGSDADQAPAEEEAKRAEAGRATARCRTRCGGPRSAVECHHPSRHRRAAEPPTVDVAGLLARGDGYLGIGDVTSARLFYERAADAGSGQGAMRLGATFDPNFLGRAGLVGTRGDQARADMWYHRARGLDTADSCSRAEQPRNKIGKR